MKPQQKNRAWRDFFQSLTTGFLIVLLYAFPGYAQQTDGKLVTGKVSSAENDEPLPGVNVLLKGTTIGTVTDASGNFQMHVTGDNPILVFSFIGFQQQEVPVHQRSQIDVQLTVDVQSLEQVVVIGYGSQKALVLHPPLLRSKLLIWKKGLLVDSIRH